MAKSKRVVWIVITPHRVFAFGNLDLARKFWTRAKRLPSMQGKEVELVAPTLFLGRKVTNPAGLVKRRTVEREIFIENLNHLFHCGA